ncbi:MAG: hypothetical protein ACOVNL_04345, partial [Prochlorococcaceae cyanobacterium]
MRILRPAVWRSFASFALVLAAAGSAWAAPAASLLKALKLPLPKPAASLFAANAIGQTSLN